MSRFFKSLLYPALLAFMASCSSTMSEPPIAEWHVDPGMRSAGSGSGRGGGKVSLTRASPGKADIVTGTGRQIGDSGVQPESNEPPPGEEGVTLNLVNLPIGEAAKIVIGDILGQDFVIDPKIEGKVTVHTAKPVSKPTALALFQSALKVSGASVIKSTGVFKIVPADQALAHGETITTDASHSAPNQLGESARVIQLKYVSASEIKRVLEPIAARGSIVRADDARNTLTLTGSPQDLATLQDAVSMFDIDTMRGMSFALVPVKSADADMLADDLRNVFGTEKEGPMAGMVRFLGNKRLSSILVISSQPEYISRARSWIQKLDARAENSEKQFYTYRVQNRPAKELVSTLGSVFGADNKGGTSSVSPRFGSTASSSAGPSSSVGGGGAQPSSGPSNALSGGGSAGGGAGGGGGMLGGLSNLGSQGTSAGMSAGSGLSVPGGPSGGGAQGNLPAVSMDNDRYRIGVDDAKNALIIMSTPDDYRRIKAVIEALDVMPNQVFIEATIAEVRLNDALKFGVRWFLQANANMFGLGAGGSSPAPNSVLGSNLLGAGVGASFPGFAYALRLPNQQVTISALNTVSNVDILSTPSLTTLDNREAFLQVGDQVPVQTLSTVSAIGNTFNSVNYTNTGVILKITPHISESGRLMLDLEQDVSNVDPNTQPGSLTPTIQQRRVKTQVVVNDNESLLLGGLVKDQRSRIGSGVPVVGDVPVFGNLFKEKGDVIEKNELVIMITPHVIRSLDEGREITEEYKRKLLDISTRAVSPPHDIEQSARRTVLDPWSHTPWRADRDTR